MAFLDAQEPGMKTIMNLAAEFTEYDLTSDKIVDSWITYLQSHPKAQHLSGSIDNLVNKRNTDLFRTLKLKTDGEFKSLVVAGQ